MSTIDGATLFRVTCMSDGGWFTTHVEDRQGWQDEWMRWEINQPKLTIHHKLQNQLESWVMSFWRVELVKLNIFSFMRFSPSPNDYSKHVPRPHKKELLACLERSLWSVETLLIISNRQSANKKACQQCWILSLSSGLSHSSRCLKIAIEIHLVALRSAFRLCA